MSLVDTQGYCQVKFVMDLPTGSVLSKGKEKINEGAEKPPVTVKTDGLKTSKQETS